MSGLFRRNGPVYLESGGYRRKRAVPRWLIILVAGAALGAGAVLYAQHLGPRRLTLEESKTFQDRTGALERENARLKADVSDKERLLQAARDEGARLTTEARAARETAETLKKGLALFEQVLPPDPRAGIVAVRAAKFGAEGESLGYQVLLTRDAAARKPLKGVVEVLVAGRRPGGRDETIGPDPVPLAFENSYLHVRGSLPLPAGFTSQQATVRVLDGEGGKLLGMRVFNVR